MLNLYKFTPFISFFGFCIYSWSPLSLVSKQKWSFSTPLNGNRGRVKAELLCFVAVFYFDWLQLTKELPHYWRIHSWKQGFFPELFLARSSHPGFDVRGRALWVDGVQRYSHSPLVIRHHCLAWPLSEGLGLPVTLSEWRGWRGSFSHLLAGCFLLVFSLQSDCPNRTPRSIVTGASWALRSDKIISILLQSHVFIGRGLAPGSLSLQTCCWSVSIHQNLKNSQKELNPEGLFTSLRTRKKNGLIL